MLRDMDKISEKGIETNNIGNINNINNIGILLNPS